MSSFISPPYSKLGTGLKGVVQWVAMSQALPTRARVVIRSTPCVMVESSEVSEPIDVRYAWECDPPTELVNAANLPASPFTTRL